MDFRAGAGCGQDCVVGFDIVLDWADEIFGPLLDLAAFDVGLFDIDPVEMRLDVAVGAGDVSDFDGEEDVAAVAVPARADFFGLVVGDAAWLDGTCSRGLQIHDVDFNVGIFFLALVDGVAGES